eukprot:7376316-Prymnesium_polylepis.1
MSAPDILLSRSFSSYLSCMSFSIARWSHPNVYMLTLRDPLQRDALFLGENPRLLVRAASFQ